MKRLSWVFIVIILVVVGWYFLWLKSLEKVESFIASNIEQLQLSNLNTDIDVHYTLKPKGFPFKAGYVVENVGLIFHEKETGHRAKVSTKGYNFVYVSVFDFYQLLKEGSLKFNTFIRDFEGVIDVESPKDKVQVRFNIARSLGEGVWGQSQSYSGTFSDLDIYVNLEDVSDKRILTVNQLKLSNQNGFIDNLLSVVSSLDISGATFYDLEGENSFAVDQFKFALDVEKLPLLSENYIESLQGVNLNNASQKQLNDFKRIFLEYINELKDAGTSISLKDYTLKIDEFVGELLLDLRLNDQLKPVGRAVINLKNIAALNHLGGLSEAPVDLSLFSEAGQEEIEVSFESDGKRIYLNGLPVIMFVPSVDVLLENLWPTNNDFYQHQKQQVIDKTDDLAKELKSVDINNLDTVDEVDESFDVSSTGGVDIEMLDELSNTLPSSATIDIKTVSETVAVSG